MSVEYKKDKKRLEFHYELDGGKHKILFEGFYVSDKLASDPDKAFKLLDLKICEMLDRAYRLGLEQGPADD